MGARFRFYLLSLLIVRPLDRPHQGGASRVAVAEISTSVIPSPVAVQWAYPTQVFLTTWWRGYVRKAAWSSSGCR